jgi:hypothetical protein
MNSERWLKLGFVIFTNEYSAGILAGFGLGIFLTENHELPTSVFIKIGALGCIVAGGMWAREAQLKKVEKEKAKKEGQISN